MKQSYVEFPPCYGESSEEYFYDIEDYLIEDEEFDDWYHDYDYIYWYYKDEEY